MVYEKNKIKGVCTGLATMTQGKRTCGGIYPALERGECRMISLTNNKEDIEVLAFQETLTHVFIESDQQWEKKVIFE